MAKSKGSPQGTHTTFNGGMQGMMRRGLVDALFVPPEPVVRKVPRIVHGPKTATGHPPLLHTDEAVLEARRLREMYGASVESIVAALLDYGVTVKPGTVNGWVDYRSRAHLVPAKRVTPYLTKSE